MLFVESAQQRSCTRSRDRFGDFESETTGMEGSTRDASESASQYRSSSSKQKRSHAKRQKQKKKDFIKINREVKHSKHTLEILCYWNFILESV